MTKIKITIKLLVAFLVLLVIGYFIAGYTLKEDITIVPTKTERVESRYLIFSNKGVFKNVDDIRFFKFNSSDVYAKLSNSIGKPVHVTVTGFRIPVLSVYKNIVSINQ